MKNIGSRKTTTKGCRLLRSFSTSGPRGITQPSKKPPNTAWMPIASIAKALVSIAARYSGERGKERLLAQGYQPEMVDATGGAGTRCIKMRGGMGLLGVNKLEELSPSYVRAAPSIRPPHVLSAFPYIDGPDDRY